METAEEYVIDDYGTALIGIDTIDLYKTNRLAMRRWGVRQRAGLYSDLPSRWAKANPRFRYVPVLSDASAPGAVAHLPEVVGVRKHERPVVEIEDVELDDVAAELNCPLERLERVLGSERGGAFVADS